jgi:hypothetical protein
MKMLKNILYRLAILLGLRSAVDYDRLGKVLLRNEKDSPQQEHRLAQAQRSLDIMRSA